MHQRFLHYYEHELRFLRELGAEFARSFPKVAGRLGLSEPTLANDDPHVERLFQGFAFLAGRVHQRLDAEFPAFTETLLEQLYGHLLKPTPSMAVVQFQPTANDGSLTSGITLPRGTELRARIPLAGGAVCQYRTAQAVELWPIKIDRIEYTSVLRSIGDLRVPTRQPIRALLRIRLSVTGGHVFDQLSLSRLPLYVSGTDDTSGRLYEALVAHASALIMRWGAGQAEGVAFGDESPVARQLGMAADETLLPAVSPAFRGFQLLHEYFAFATRFHFVELRGLGAGVRRCSSDRLELILPLTHYDPALEGELERDRLQLFASPAVNLFRRRCDVALHEGAQEFEVIPDRTHPLDYEIHSVTRVVAHESGRGGLREYQPRHSFQGRADSNQLAPHYALERRPRTAPYGEQHAGARTDYAGTEVYLRLGAPGDDQQSFASKQLAVDALCTNRGLPLLLSRDRQSYFTLTAGAPVDAVSCLAGPSAPRSVSVDGAKVWHLISYLNLNYLSLSEETGGSEALRELLALYARFGDPLLRREAEGIRAVRTRPAIGPYPQHGRQHFVRGLEVELQCDEEAFTQGALALASVLAVLFAKQVTPQSFAQTIFRTTERGEVYRLPAMPGVRNAL